MTNFDTIVRPAVEALMQPGETLQGMFAANRKRTFSGSLVVVGVTDRRLIVQPLDRRARPDGEPTSITPEALIAADLSGAGSEWWNAAPHLLDAAATFTLRSADGEKIKLIMMTGDGLFGALGGGEPQREGVAALVAWLQRRFSAP